MIDAKLRESIDAAFAAAQREPTADEIAAAVTADIAIAQRMSTDVDIEAVLPHVSRVRARIRSDALAVALAKFAPTLLPRSAPGGGMATEGNCLGGDIVGVIRGPTEEALAPIDADFDAAAEQLHRAREAVGRRSGGAHHGDGAMLVEIARVATEIAQSRAWRDALTPKAEAPAPEVPADG